MNSLETLKKYFGYDSFREGQKRIIDNILSGRDILAIMPTGAGKSICYQVPALMLPGITLVISPLISLMQDQVKALNEVGINAAYINSSLTETQINRALGLATMGQYKIIYVAPERLESGNFLYFAQNADISMVTVDEAHCISQWGQDFRPSYVKITDFVANLSKRPIVSAFTATATQEVKNDIQCILKLNHPEEVITGFDRSNLYYMVEHIRKKDAYIINYIEKHPEDSGVIYCATRKNVESLYEILLAKGIKVTKYHAGLSNEQRKNNQDDFIYDRAPIVIATNAFGMGIDKSNVRYVIHYNMPQSMENYYQEAGRAGRDGEDARCILLFSPQDIMINKFLLEKKEFLDVPFEDIDLIKERDAYRLQVMEGYCKTTACLRNYILQYFGEKPLSSCDSCGNCHREYLEKDMTFEAKWIINCVAETKGRYGIVIVTGTLLGANRARLREIGANLFKSYGMLKGHSEEELKNLISQMILDGLLIQSKDQYATLQLGDITPLKKADAKVMIRTYQEKEQEVLQRRERKSKSSKDELTSAGFSLFGELKELRLVIAREEGMPPYIIFNDKTLVDMSSKTPMNKEEMLAVSGVGENKYAKYGERFLEVIHNFLEKNQGAVTSISQPIDETVKGRIGQTRTKKIKEEFYLTKEEAEEFQYTEYYYMTEMREEMNRICNEEEVKKITNIKIGEYLNKIGLVREVRVHNMTLQEATEEGLRADILMEEVMSQKGNAYLVLKLPEAIQRRIVSHFTR